MKLRFSILSLNRKKEILFFIYGFFLFYLLTDFLSGKNEGDLGRYDFFNLGGLNKIPIDSFTSYQYFHFHHWLAGMLILLFLIYLKKWNAFIYGAISGAVIQGLTYSDAFTFLV